MDRDSSGAFTSLIAGGFFLTFAIVALAFTIFFVWLFWRIFTKAGYTGALGLLCLIPSIGPIVCLIILAFGTWPSQVQPIVTASAITPAVQ